MDEISGMLQKIRTLTVQAANGTNTKEDRAALSKEATALATEINRIATQTTFAGKTVLNGMGSSSIFGKDGAAGGAGQNGGPGKAGKTGTMTLQIGSNKGDTISFDIDSVMFSKIADEGGAAGNNKLVGTDKIFKTDNGTGAVTVTFTKANFADATNDVYIGKVIELMDTAISKVDGMRAGLGALQNHSSACNLVPKSCDFMSFCSFFFTHNVVSMIKYIMFKNCWTGWKIHCIKTIFTGVSRQVARKNTQLRHWC